MRVTFLHEGLEDLESVRGWEPERDPLAFPDGVGHGFFQTFLAVRALHRETRIASRPDGADVYVIYQKTRYGIALNAAVLLEALRRGRVPAVVSIHSDARTGAVPFFHVTRSIVPNLFRATSARDGFLPLLPQNGLIPARAGASRVAVYGYRKNRPDHLLTPAFVDRCRRAGIDFEFADLDGPEPDRVRDYSTIAVALCLRSGSEPEPGRKPPTKLVNAWVANAIPVVDREAGYLSLGVPGRDCLLLTTDHRLNPEAARDELFQLLLTARSPEAAPMRAAIRARAEEFAPGRIAAAYLAFFRSTPDWVPPTPGRGALALAFAAFLAKRLAAWLDRRTRRLVRTTRAEGS